MEHGTAVAYTITMLNFSKVRKLNLSKLLDRTDTALCNARTTLASQRLSGLAECIEDMVEDQDRQKAENRYFQQAGALERESAGWDVD